jgi:two-component SAPR family response regulator
LPNLRVVPIFPTQSIVLVDDEKSYTDLMVGMLAENLDCPVHGFVRPLAALKALPTIRPGVIVTDYFMPEITGIDFIRQASPLVPGAVFVMITGNNLSAQKDELDRLTVLQGFLPKPFGWRKLADEILRVWPVGIPAPRYRADSTSL